MNIEFLKSKTNHRREAQDKITRNCSADDVQQYLSLYKQAINQSFTINVNCPNCVGEMVQRLWRWYDEQEASGRVKDFEWLNTSQGSTNCEERTEWQGDEMLTEIKTKRNETKRTAKKNRKP
jgi:hypothetical protein